MGNQLGNYPVERCLVVEGRKIPFPAPGGGKDADFEYNIEFRSTGESKVVDWSADAVHKEVSARMGSLASCGPPSEEEVRAVAYIQPGGTVPSVGLVSRGRLDIMNAMCVVEQNPQVAPVGRRHAPRARDVPGACAGHGRADRAPPQDPPGGKAPRAHRPRPAPLT